MCSQRRGGGSGPKSSSLITRHIGEVKDRREFDLKQIFRCVNRNSPSHPADKDVFAREAVRVNVPKDSNRVNGVPS